MIGTRRAMPSTPSRKLSGCVAAALTERTSVLIAPLVYLQEARKVRENAQVAWVPRFFEAHDGGWALKAGVKEALAAALVQAPAEQVPPQPATPASAVRRSVDGGNGW